MSNAVPVTYMWESSRYVIKFRPFVRGSLTVYQSVCYMAFECRRSNLIHIRFLDFARRVYNQIAGSHCVAYMIVAVLRPSHLSNLAVRVTPFSLGRCALRTVLISSSDDL